MAEKLYPLASADGSIKYYASDVQRHYANIIGNKVIIGDTLKVSAKSTPDLSVNVGAGTSVNLGKEYRNSATLNLPITANTSTYNRIDNIVIDFSLTTNFLKIVKGVASSSPVAPVVGSNQILLAQVLVGAGVTSIQSSNITDCRAKDGQHIIESLSDLIFTIESNLNNLIDKVNAPSQITTLQSYPYSPTTLEATPNGIYRIEGNIKADVRGMELSKMKDGDKIYFSVETAVGTLTLSRLTNNFWLPSDIYNCPRDKVTCMIMINGVMRLLE